mmetsp:Transcript_46470/g.85141  ORF Transcript_46470/g.85141 Transcript_46470/m.85141 type:complete len:713 (-) Transcript_46470:33-2171(-)
MEGNTTSHRSCGTNGSVLRNAGATLLAGSSAASTGTLTRVASINGTIWLQCPSVGSWHQQLSPRRQSPLTPRLDVLPVSLRGLRPAVTVEANAMSPMTLSPPKAKDGEGVSPRERAKARRRKIDEERESHHVGTKATVENFDRVGEHSPVTFAMTNGNLGQDSHTAEVFRRLDTNEDGVIDRDEFKTQLMYLDPDMFDDPHLVRRLFKAMDTNADAVIDWHELHDWMNKSDAWDEARESKAFASSFRRKDSRKNPVWVKTGNQVLTQVYDVEVQKIGEGNFGLVRRATHKVTKAVRAIKTINKKKVSREELDGEIELMSDLDHPHILKLYEVVEDIVNIYLVMELCAGGELFDRIVESKSFSEKQAANVMQQIGAGVRYIHLRSICHRDLKPENFLLQARTPIEESVVKIIDFGLACRFNAGEPMSSQLGTPGYVAPEVLKGSYDKSCDLWSCGVIMFILLCGYPPFGGSTPEEVCAATLKGEYVFHEAFWNAISVDAKDLIKRLLTYDPQQRYTAEQTMRHTWIKDVAPAAHERPLQLQELGKMKAYGRENKLKKRAMQVVARELQTDQIQQLQDTFCSLDKDGDGSVTFAELRYGIEQLGLSGSQLEMLQELMEAIDDDHDGVIHYTEFLAATLDTKVCEQESVCWAAFRMFDENGDGKINKTELAAVLANDDLEAYMGSDVLSRILQDYDADGDGQISFEEFMAMMREN